MSNEEMLSQEEIDNILKSMALGESAEDIFKEYETEERRIREYDFRRPMKFSREQLRTLQLVHENFARELSTYLSGRCRTFVDVKYASVDQITFSEFQKSLSSPTFMAVFSADVFSGSSIFQMGLDIGYVIIDRLLGGTGSVLEELRTPTELEMNILRKETAVILRTLSRSWMNIEEFEATLENLETNPQFVQVASSNEMTILITLSVTIKDVQGFVNLCFPSSTLEPLTDKLSTRMWTKVYKRQEITRENLKQILLLSKLKLTAILGRTTLTLNDILNMEVGDVIRTDSFFNEPIDIEIQGEKVFKAQIGKIKGFYSVKILKKDKELLEKILVEESIKDQLKKQEDTENVKSKELKENA
ncbi:flagellar motor switch protein FliM [Petrotoga sp. 9PWA.NaAc.5.4]|uniref:flagellar motor switch protein FliM n=1 Tax=Petrotoga sp. 9PWA.NaAc.5.4 TaxID=1434328 RepID=UPI000CA7716C|nr:flagellar motor switch protein FliM [Petrotoga sp. 9PWA.NaAc.5.4]PNR92493.1 flagellar motor switch protein FliM [Petrotoga sp. 9PWA.NaAc.5.4]